MPQHSGEFVWNFQVHRLSLYRVTCTLSHRFWKTSRSPVICLERDITKVRDLVFSPTDNVASACTTKRETTGFSPRAYLLPDLHTCTWHGRVHQTHLSQTICQWHHHIPHPHCRKWLQKNSQETFKLIRGGRLTDIKWSSILTNDLSW